jgi:PAS domain S-box-containing protein
LSSTSEIERLKVELDALRESAEKHRLLIEATNTGYIILDEAGRVLDANAEYVRLTGHVHLEQILGRPVTEWTAPGDLARNAAEVRRCMETGAVRNLEIDYLGPDGRVTPIEINATVRRAPAGVTILTVCRDISGRRRAEEALRNSEHRYRATIDSMGEAIHVVDPDLRIELLNRTGEKWMREIGIAGDIVGRSIFEVFPFLPEGVRDEYRRVFAGEGPLITEELNMVDGREIATETRKIPIVEGGRVAHVVTVIRDTTETVRAQERLRQTEKMEALGQLAGGIAHDFNNQLSAVLGYADLLAHGVEEPLVREYATAIARVAARSADLTRQLLTFARKGRVRSAPLDVHALLREVAGLLGRTIDPRIQVAMRLDAPRATTIGDSALLQSALLNLALNARDAMPDGGLLTFATDVVAGDVVAAGAPPDWMEVGARLRIRISDTGVGMAEEVRRRLFEPFFTTKGPGHGTGMGLAAVYGTVTNHGGAISVESEPGRGATFTVLLPLALETRVSEAPAAGTAPTAGQGHILLADDEPAVLHATAQALGALGYRVTACTDGEAAVSRYREAWRGIDLVLLDVMMPALDGVGALAEMRRINPGVRAILYSGQPVGDEAQRLIDEGIAAFLEKPFTLSELGSLVASVI